MVSTAERQNLTGRTAITSWKRWMIFRKMSKPLQNQSNPLPPWTTVWKRQREARRYKQLWLMPPGWLSSQTLVTRGLRGQKFA